MKRREFIILTTIGATSGAIFSACGHPENKLIPALIPDDEYVPGIDYWKASTCAMCPAGCGIVVRTREHKANKIEGNPLHPVNRGSLCARGQAGLQVLYNPDRIKSPLMRTGQRFGGEFKEIGWDEALQTLTSRLREIKDQGQAASVILATGARRGVTGLAAELLSTNYGTRLVNVSPGNEAGLAESYAQSYGRAVVPIFDLSNATYLLSFGARFLETWHSPLLYSQAYGAFRRTSGRARGRFVQVEPRMSLTAANADEWLPAALGSEGLVALAIAQVIVREGLLKNSQAPTFIKEPFDTYAPEQTAERTDVSPEKIIRLAREFAAAPHPLALGGGAALATARGKDSLRAINFLNTLAGNLNQPGGVLLPALDHFDPLEKLRGRGKAVWSSSLSDAFQGGAPQALLIHQANPVYHSPGTLDQLKTIPFIVSFASFMDETTELADLILPDHSYLESWDISGVLPEQARAAVSISQPVVKPEFNTRQTADLWLGLAREFANQEAGAGSFESAEQIVRQAATHLPSTDHPAASAASGAEPSEQTAEPAETEEPEDPFEAFSGRGVWVGQVSGSRPQPPPAVTRAQTEAPEEAASDDQYPLTLLAYEHVALGMGTQANLPWLQELPDPMTTVMWGSWVELNPKTAEQMGIKDGDLVEVRTQQGTVSAPAVLFPAIRPDVVAMPFGQGHTAYGRYAKDRGVNPEVLSPLPAWGEAMAIRVRVTKAAGDTRLIRFGSNLPERIEIKR